MQTILESAREIPVITEVDVLVVGAGSAGLPAAIAAARAGADVLLIERYGYVGGAVTGGFVITVPNDKRDSIVREIDDRLLKVGRSAMNDMWGGKNCGLVWCPETLKWLGLKMLEEAGVRMLFHSWCVGTLMEDDLIAGVIIENKAGRQAIRAQVVVDCTGDGDVAAFAGVPSAKGGKDGKMLPVTMMFMLANVDDSKYTGKRPGSPPWNLYYQPTRFCPGYLNVWGGSVKDIDGTDPCDLTKAENELRRQVFDLVEWMRANMAGCEQAYVPVTAPQVGVRETRHILGEYQLSRADYESGIVFDDHVGFLARKQGSIPYRSLLPQEVDNLLIAGRCFSIESEARELRDVVTCMVTGHAAGAAAALAARDGASPRELDVTKLQACLEKDGSQL